MAGAISFGGLSSGMDTQTIVKQLTTLKQQHLINPLQTRYNKIQTQQANLGSIENSFNALKTTATDLTSSTAFISKQVTTSRTDVATVTITDPSKASASTYQLSNVSQLAQPDRVIFQGVANKSTTTLGSGTIGVTYKGVTTNVNVTAGSETLEGIQSAINSANLGITASIVNDGGATPYRLVLTSNDTGSDKNITLDTSNYTGLTVDAISNNAENQAQDASFKLNGISMTSKSNTITTAIDGASITLMQKNTTDTTNITVSNDTEAIAAMITNFITSYSNLRSSLKNMLSANPNTKKLGPLAQDTTLNMANIKTTSIMQKMVSNGTFNALSELGISGNGSTSLTVDATKLASALEKDAAAVKKIFTGTGSGDGIATEMKTFMDSLVGSSGVISKKKEVMGDSMESIDKQITRYQSVVKDYQSRLTKKFTGLEKTMTRLKASQNEIQSYTDSLNWD